MWLVTSGSWSLVGDKWAVVGDQGLMVGEKWAVASNGRGRGWSSGSGSDSYIVLTIHRRNDPVSVNPVAFRTIVKIPRCTVFVIGNPCHWLIRCHEQLLNDLTSAPRKPLLLRI